MIRYKKYYNAWSMFEIRGNTIFTWYLIQDSELRTNAVVLILELLDASSLISVPRNKKGYSVISTDNLCLSIYTKSRTTYNTISIKPYFIQKQHFANFLFLQLVVTNVPCHHNIESFHIYFAFVVLFVWKSIILQNLR